MKIYRCDNCLEQIKKGETRTHSYESYMTAFHSGDLPVEVEDREGVMRHFCSKGCWSLYLDGLRSEV